jgi:chromosome segregation ATPase
MHNGHQLDTDNNSQACSTMAHPDYASMLSTLREQQASHPLTILSLAEPVIAAANTTSPSDRKSNISDSANSDLDNPTPASLLADLTHYKELFSKLRFSYLEQVTKEKYLRSIVGDPPLLVNHAENVALEEKLSTAKAELKAKKEDVGRLVEETVVELRKELAEREGAEPLSEDPRMNAGLEETLGMMEEQRERARELDRQIAALQRALPAKMRECEVVDGELDALERRKNDITAAATEARRIREEGGRDELEEKGRWYRSTEVVLRGVIGVDA